MWCVGEKERRREGEGEEEEREKRKGKDLSLLLPINSPAGLTPCGDTLSNHSPNTLPLNPYPSNPDPKMGDPHLLPTRGKGGKRGGKGHFLHILSSIFLSGGEPPDPPLLTGTRKKKTRKARARVNLTSRTKSIDLNETS